jgi:hypothetical protein
VSGALVTGAAVAFCVLMAALTLFQAALVAGAPIGHFAWGGQHRVLPRAKRVGSVVAIGLYLLFSVIVLQRVGLIEVIPWPGLTAVATWVLFGYFVLGIALNAISRSRPERLTMVPVCVVLSLLTAVVALS